MSEEETLIYWEKWLKGKESIKRQWADEYGNTDTDEQRAFFNRVLVLIEEKY
ncbi:hypothetical protein [Polaribacter sp. IC073]|uniref:hypothetical protein n=1 Tax=Polaribacter sp. IC073 TaxID=2508540 RepID=UPI001673E4F7|nr:hypothetical protein [Polaribacter sp. IC073]